MEFALVHLEDVKKGYWRSEGEVSSAHDAFDEVLVALRRIIHATDLHSKRVSREIGLTVPQIVILKSVRALGEVTTNVISRHVSLSQPTVTHILDRLEERGFVERYRSSRDRRVVHTRLTRQGHSVVRKSPGLLHERFLREFATLSDRRQKEILRVLKSVAGMMGVSTLDAAPLLDVGPVEKDAGPRS